MKRDDERQETGLIDLGDATVETKGEIQGVPTDGIALRPLSGLSED